MPSGTPSSVEVAVDHETSTVLRSEDRARHCFTDGAPDRSLPPGSNRSGATHWQRLKRHFDDLLVDTLKDIYYAEKQIRKALPKDSEGCAVRGARGRLPDSSR